MDFNARMSHQFRSQANGNNGGRGKQQQNDADAFMRLVRNHDLLKYERASNRCIIA